MKHIFSLLLAIYLMPTIAFSQDDETTSFVKSNEIGVFGATGFNKITSFNNFGAAPKNVVAAFGIFYARTFVPHFKVRLGFGMSYMFSKNQFDNGYANYRSAHIEVPLQFHYIFNPDSKAQFYVGLGVSINRWMNTLVRNELDGKKSEASTYNPKRGMYIVPTLAAGVNLNLNEEWSIYLQPEYRPLMVENKTNTQLRSLIVQLGVLYHL